MAALVSSAVRLPTPEPQLPNDAPISNGKRKRSPDSRSPSPPRYRSPPRRRSRSRSDARDRYDRRQDDRPPPGALPKDVDRDRAVERKRQMEIRQRATANDKPLSEEEKQAAAKREFQELMEKRSGGVYVPPARLRELQAQIVDKTSKEYQRLRWEALKKSINGLINKVNVGNIKHIVPELFGENLIRGQGLFCRSIMRAQAASLPFTPIFAAMVAIVNTKLPQIGQLLVKRLVVQFRKAFKRNDKAVCLASSTFLAHLANQQVTHELLIAQILLLLLRRPTDDSVEIAVGIVKEMGQHLEQMNPQIASMIFDQLRNILHESTELEKRTQYMIEVLFQIRRDKYKEHPAIKEELDLVEEEDLITHQVDLDDADLDINDGANVFKLDPDYEENEDKYNTLRADILGEGDDSDDDDDNAASEESESDDEEDKALAIKDQTNTNLVNLRSTIYLTIKSSGQYEEAVHKLMKIDLPAGMESELTTMIVECASQERTYEKFYGGIADRFCRLNRLWRELTQDTFVSYYGKIHRYNTNAIRIIAQLFGHLMGTDAINWDVLSCINLNEEETTSSSRIFIKVLFEELVAEMGLEKLVQRLKEGMLQTSLGGLFPTNDPRHTRFAINFFTAIELGRLTDGMRDWLKETAAKEEALALERREDSYSSDSDSASDSGSDRGRNQPRSRRTRSVSSDRSLSRSDTQSDNDRRSNRRQRASRPRSRRDASSDRSRSSSRSRTPPRRMGERSRPRSEGGRSGGERKRQSRSVSSSRSPSQSRSRSPRRR